MRIPKQEDVAILVMLELARAAGRHRVPLSEISRNHGLSLAYLKKLARSLRRCRLVESKEGVGGGYRLARAPGTISLWEIMQAVADRPYTVPEKLRRRQSCPVYARCLPQTIQHRLSQAVEKSFSTMTLESLERGK